MKTIVSYEFRSDQTYTVPFEYLTRRFVKVFLIGPVERRELVMGADFRFVDRTSIRTTVQWPGEEEFTSIELRRVTSATDRLVEFNDGSVLRANELNVSQIQALHIAEESRDSTVDNLGLDSDGNYNARSRRIVNVADAINDNDAVNLGRVKYLDAAAKDIGGRFLTPKPGHPAARDDGMPLQFGDRYMNTADGMEYIYRVPGGWSTSNIDSTTISGAMGAYAVGYKQRNVGVKLDEIISASDYLFGRTPSQAIQEAIETAAFLGGGEVIVAPGLWVMDAPLYLRNGVIIKAYGARFDWSNVTGNAAVFISGSIGPDVALALEADRGALKIDTATAHGFSPGDLFLLLSQRNALHTDAGEDWRLGTGTTNSRQCYFAEFNFVNTVTDGNGFTTAAPIVFPKYRPDATQETDTLARFSATVAKITPIRDAKWIGGKFIGMHSGIGAGFRSNWAYNCKVDEVEIDRGQSPGAAIFWVNAFMCSSYKSICRTDPGFNIPDSDHHLYNRFKTAGVQGVFFDFCEDHYGSQSFDFSYFNASLPSIMSGMRSCTTIGSRKNAMTTHPGCYMIDILNNNFLQCWENGVAIRHRRGRVEGNRITSGSDKGDVKKTYGLQAYGGWSRENILASNIIEGFYYGLMEGDDATAEGIFTKSGNLWISNQVSFCAYGMYIDPNAISRNNVRRGTNIRGNTFRNIRIKFMMVDPYAPGVVFDENHCYGPLGSPGQAVQVSGNSPAFCARRNHFYDLGATVIPIGLTQIQDTVVYPKALWDQTSDIYENLMHGPHAAINAHRDQVRPSTAEQAGRPGTLIVTDGAEVPFVLPGQAILWVDKTDRALKIKWGDAIVANAATRP